MARKKGFGGGGANFREAGRKADHTSPLRKIVDRVDRPVSEGSSVTLTYEVLECGHEQLPKKDITGGETSARCRRCRKCAREAENSGRD